MIKTSESMQRLRKLTEQLPPFPETVGPDVPGWKEYKIPKGTSIAQNILNIPRISVARWFNSNGSEIPYHHHEQREWIIVISGSMYVQIEDEEKQLLEWGDYIFIEPKTVHRLTFDEDCWYLAITVPRSSDWPAD